MLQSVYRRREKSGRRWNGARHRWGIVRLKREGDQDHGDPGLASCGRDGQGGRHSGATAPLIREFKVSQSLGLSVANLDIGRNAQVPPQGSHIDVFEVLTFETSGRIQ